MKLFESQTWDKVQTTLCEGLQGQKLDNFKRVLDVTKKELMENATAGAFASGNVATVPKVILPILRRVMPNVIANELIGVQPISAPVAQIHTMRYIYADNYAGTTAGSEALSPFEIAKAYSGNGDAANPRPASTAVAEGAAGKRLTITTLKQTAEAKTRYLNARWTTEGAMDAQSQLGLDIESELMAGLAQEITQEIDQEILGRLRNLARTGATYDMSNPTSFTGNPTFVGDRHAVLTTLINQQANIIAARTRRGRANWVVVDPNALTVLQSATTSTFAQTTKGDFVGSSPDNQKRVGTLNSTMAVYVDTYAQDGTPVLIGYKGQGEYDAAAFYCPYVPLMATEPVRDPYTFELTVRFFTRYAYVELSNSASSFGNAADYVSKINIPAGTLQFI